MKTSFILSVVLFFLVNNNTAIAQKIDVDSLLVQLISDFKLEKNPQEIIQKAKTGLKIAPDYLDYYVLLGRSFERIQMTDSSKFYYRKVISKSDKYPDAYNYLINLEISNHEYNSAIEDIEKAKLL